MLEKTGASRDEIEGPEVNALPSAVNGCCYLLGLKQHNKYWLQTAKMTAKIDTTPGDKNNDVTQIIKP